MREDTGIAREPRENAGEQGERNYSLPLTNEVTSVNSLCSLLKGMKRQSWTIYTAFVYHESH